MISNRLLSCSININGGLPLETGRKENHLVKGMMANGKWVTTQMSQMGKGEEKLLN
jgi:hypothetical protein